MDNATLDGLLDQHIPALRTLCVTGRRGSKSEKPTRSLPSVRSLVLTNLNHLRFHVPHLTSFHFEWRRVLDESLPVEFGDHLLDFFRSCPLLEVVSLSYGGSRHRDLGFAVDEASTKPVSLSHLRSFTHESTSHEICIGLFNRLSLPQTCVVGFVINDEAHGYQTAIPGFAAPRDQSYLSDVKRVNIGAYTVVKGYSPHLRLKTELVNSRNTRISFSMGPYLSFGPSYYAIYSFLNFLQEFGATHSVESLHFDGYPVLFPPSLKQTTIDMILQLRRFRNLKNLTLWGCDPIGFLVDSSSSGSWCPTAERLVIGSRIGKYYWDGEESEVVKRVRDVAVARKKDGSPLKSIVMCFRTAETLLRKCRGEIEELKSCVESVEVGGLRFLRDVD